MWPRSLHDWRSRCRGSRSRGPEPSHQVGQPELTARLPISPEPRTRVVAQLPADLSGGIWRDAGDIVRAAWTPCVRILIADLTTTANWSTASLESLRYAERDLAARGTELRLVVWSPELYATLQAMGVTSHILVFANIESALRAPASHRSDMRG